ncbi:MAG: mechanosensitive ion channel [Halioglobus sp.]
MLRVLILWTLLSTTLAWGQAVAPAVTVAQLDAAVARVTANLPEDDPQRAALLKSYADTREALSNLEKFRLQTSGYIQSRANAVKEAEAIEEKLVALHSAPQKAVSVSKSTSLAELEQIILVDKSELDAKKSQLVDIRAAVDAIPQRPAEIRTRIAELADLLTDLKSQLDVANRENPSGSKDEAALWLAEAQYASVAAEKTALEEELLSQPMRLELLKARLDQTSYEIVQLEKRAEAMAQRVNELRQDQAVQALAAADLVLAETQNKHELIRQLADRNVQLAKTFTVRNEEIDDAEKQDSSTKSKAEQLEADLTSIEHKLALLGMSTAVGEILRDRQAQLPNQSEIGNKIEANADAIQASSLRQVEFEEERRLLRNRSEYIESLVAGLPPQVVAEVKDDLNKLVRSRRDLLRKAIDLENTYALALGDLDFALRRYDVAVNAYRDFISARLLWIPSRDRFGLFHTDQTELLKQIDEIFAAERWLTLLRGMPGEMVKQPLTMVLLLVVLILIYYTRRIKRQLIESGKQVGYVRSDNFANTAQALGLSILLSLKWPLLTMVAAWLFQMQDKESELATALYQPMLRTSFYFWGLEFLRIALLPKGLVDMHFRWPSSRVSLISRRILALELTLLPSAFLVGFFLTLYPRAVGGPLGTMAVVFVLFSIAHFFLRLPEFVQSKIQLIFRDSASVENPFWSRVVRKLLFWIPVAAILAVFLGYTFTANEIALMLIRTFVLLSCILILHELGLRWLSLTRRRMAFDVRQEQAKAEHGEAEISVEDEILENDPELLNDQGTKLLNLLTLIAGFLGTAWIWSDIFPALGLLDSVSLWHQTTVIDGREVADPVSLADLSRALVFAGVGWVALRRIPGLLEIFLRQKIKVAPASAYALARVFQYASTLLLVIFVVGALGVSWSSLQWAVAALSLGIGFGLQEIVANFISGLIILFEQPIRLGDTVTVGDVSGTVTRIQMRATTIRDFDRRELLVPNKEFITSRLLNWSLSDSVTRRVIQVGAAYGTDMDEALEIVRDVAKKHPLVLAEPEPSVTFDEFGDNSLLISLRYFIEQLDKRLGVDSELRLAINRRFKEADISIAFPQRDIHLDTTQPLEIKMVEGDPAA